MMIMRRNSSIELVRILSMIMIIILHYNNDMLGGALGHVSKGEINYHFLYIVESICIVGVNVFILVTAFFSESVKEIKVRKIVDLYFLMIFYDFIGYVISVIIGENTFSMKEVIVTVLPFLVGRRWFVETYIILMMLIPFINKIINHINKKSHELAIFIQVALFSIWPTIGFSAPVLDHGYGIITFIMLFFIGTYIKKYIVKMEVRKDYLIPCCVMTSIISIVAIYFQSILHIGGGAWDYCNFFVLVGSVSLFLLFSCGISEFYNDKINGIAKHTYGVFLIHTNRALANTIYQNIFKCEEVYDSKYLWVHLIITVVLLFVICIVIDAIRAFIFKHTYDKWAKNINILNTKIDIL